MRNTPHYLLLTLLICFVTTVQVSAQTSEASIVTQEQPIRDEPALTPPSASNNMPGMGMGNTGMGGPGGAPGYSVTWMPAQQVQGQPTNLEVIQQSLNAGFPLYRQDGNMVLLTTRLSSTLLQSQAVMPDSHQPLPEQLWNISLGAMYIRKFDGGSSLGVMGSLGSASDKPFNQLRDYSPMLLAFYRLPVREYDAWMFSLMYSPVGEINFPIPGVSYQYQPSDNFRMNIGIPFSLMYRPLDDVTIDVSYMILRTINAQVNWKLTDCWNVYGKYSWGNQSWFLADRTEDRERLFMYDMRLMGGVRYALTDKLNFDVGIGYVFDRFFFTGTKSNEMQHDRIDLAPGLIATLSLQLRF